MKTNWILARAFFLSSRPFFEFLAMLVQSIRLSGIVKQISAPPSLTWLSTSAFDLKRRCNQITFQVKSIFRLMKPDNFNTHGSSSHSLSPLSTPSSH